MIKFTDYSKLLFLILTVNASFAAICLASAFDNPLPEPLSTPPTHRSKIQSNEFVYLGDVYLGIRWSRLVNEAAQRKLQTKPLGAFVAFLGGLRYVHEQMSPEY